MIVVASCARSGSSLQMQILKELGIPVSAPQFLPEHDKQYNPLGYYEMNETINGISDNRYKGMAIKLFAFGLTNTDKSFIDKIIVCKRSKEDVIKSAYKVLKIDYSDLYDESMEAINRYVADMDYFVADYDAVVDNPFGYVVGLSNYLGLNTSLHQVKFIQMLVQKGSEIHPHFSILSA